MNEQQDLGGSGLEDELDDQDLSGDDPLSPEKIGELVLYTLDWSVESLLARVGTTLDVNPAFQRRDAWTPTRKSLYVESLMLGLPVPQVVLAEDRQKGSFIVLDGKQRLITLKQFAAPDAAFPALALRGLDFLTELEGKTFEDVRGSLTAFQYADAFLAQPVRTIVVRNWINEEILYHVFVRLNQNSLALSPQELRQALFPGEFTGWIDRFSADSHALHDARRLPKADFRMRDAEMLLRFVALTDRLEVYGGNLRHFLDETCRLGNEQWETERPRYEQMASNCEAGVRIARRVFGKDAFLRFEDGHYVRRFNIAVFDAMAVVLGSPEVVSAHLDESACEALKAAYEHLSEENDSFAESLKSTTKTIDATVGRIASWGVEVSQVLGISIDVVDRAQAIMNARA